LTEIIRESVEIARSTLEERGALLGRTARIDLHLMPLPPVTGEPSELRQIFLNLLLNAQDAMPQGGTVTIHAAASGETVVVTVEDEGQGIAPEHLDHIFDPFFTTKGERGTGLGLSTAYGTMRRLGGKISAHNQPGSGAVFTLVFPVSHGDGPGTVPHRSRASGPRRLMVIDDDLENLEAMAAALRLRGHEVVALSSGAEALQMLKLDTRGFDAIFCDLGMPQLDGWEVARRVKEGNSSPLVFYLVTGWAQEIAVDDPRRSLVDGIIAKPINPSVLDSLPEPVLRVRPSAA
jgi:CheY-like chemotaxis protein